MLSPLCVLKHVVLSPITICMICHIVCTDIALLHVLMYVLLVALFEEKTCHNNGNGMISLWHVTLYVSVAGSPTEMIFHTVHMGIFSVPCALLSVYSGLMIAGMNYTVILWISAKKMGVGIIKRHFAY